MESRSAIDFYERSLGMSGPDGRWGVREARVLAGLGEAHYRRESKSRKHCTQPAKYERMT